jgi:FAD/FMN-containing dehydrogenase
MASLKGEAIQPGHVAYDQSRRVWNAAIDHRPSVIVRPGCVEDIRHAVRFAMDQGLPVSVKGGGHSVAGHSVGEDSVMIDLAPLSDIKIDPGARRMTVRGGATWGEAMEVCAPHGLATPGAFNHHVGVSGLTLGGGYGVLSRLHGLAADNLVEAEVLTADGEVRIVGESEHPELFWCLRGAGANFGVVTALTFRMHDVGTWLAGSMVWPVSRYREVLAAYREFTSDLPDAASAYLGFKNLPRQEGYVFLIAFHAGAPEDGQRILDPLRNFPPPLTADFRPRSYLELHDGNVEAFPAGHRNYWKACFLPQLPDAALAALAETAERTSGMDYYIVIEHLGGAMGAVDATTTAFPHRNARFGLAITCKWRRPSDGDPLIAAAQSLHAAVWPHSTGGIYVNYLGKDATDSDIRAAYGTNIERLRRAKAIYDPGNLFRCNANILPGT